MKDYNRAALSGTDCLGRRLSPPEALRGKQNRLVGMFYFMCHDGTAFPSDGGEFFEDVLDSYDIETLGSPDSPFYDYKYGTPFYWGRPLFGCYRNLDEWVVRRHVEMLTLADIDFLVIDSTNSRSWVKETELLMRILDEGLRAGYNTPKVAFYTNTDSGTRVREIYDGIYASRLYPDTWFCLDGKPVIIGIAEQTEPELLSFFHFKNSQWPNTPVKDNAFPWIDFGEQQVYSCADGSERIVSVSVAQNSDPDTACFGQNYFYGSDGSHGRSYHDGEASITDDSYKYGYNFQEQWRNAEKLDPDIVFVTGWNEWTAGVWRMGENNPVAVFDCLNAEYSRDIEPMQGGFGDAYYMQLIDEVRKFKGIEKGNSTRLPVQFNNFTTARVQRESVTPKGTISDNSLRNIITEISVSQENDTLVFTATTRDAINSDDRIGDFMRLFVSRSGSDEFDMCFNLRMLDGEHTVAAQRVNGRWERIGTIGYTLSDNKLTLRVPRHLLADAKELYIKWVDSRVHCRKGDDFYLYGSSAPLGRLYYNIEL